MTKAKLTTVSRIEALREIPLTMRIPILGAYIIQEKDNPHIIITVTSILLESFSSKSGQRIMSNPLCEDYKIVCSEYSQNSSIGPSIFCGCSDGRIRAYSTSKLQLASIIQDDKITSNDPNQHLTKSAIRMTCIICPLNNAVVCGYSDGTLKSFYVESRKLAKEYKYPFEFTHDSHSLPVSCMSFCRSKNYLITGYYRRIIPGLVVEEIPIVIYSLQKASYIRHYSGARDSILSVELLEDQKYMISCTAKQILIWRYESLNLFFVYNFWKNIPNLFPQAMCTSSNIESSLGLIFSAFDSGLLVCIHLELPKDTQSWGTNQSEIERFIPKSSFDYTSPYCQPLKLLKTSYQDTIGVKLIDACPRFLRYHRTYHTLIVGDGLSRLKLLADLFVEPQI